MHKNIVDCYKFYMEYINGMSCSSLFPFFFHPKKYFVFLRPQKGCEILSSSYPIR